MITAASAVAAQLVPQIKQVINELAGMSTRWEARLPYERLYISPRCQQYARTTN